jgi:hypothetical protein
MTLLMLLTVVSTVNASATISGSNAIPLDDLLEKSEKTTNITVPFSCLLFGFVIIDAIIMAVEPYNDSYIYACAPVKKLTVIGFGFTCTFNGTFNGTDVDGNYSDIHFRFYMKTFTNVTQLAFATSRKLDTTLDYKHFSLFVTPRHLCVFLFI